MGTILTTGIDKCGLTAPGIQKMFITNWQDLKGLITYDGLVIDDLGVIFPWFDFSVERSKMDFKEVSQDTEHNIKFTDSIVMFYPKMDALTNATLEELLKSRLLILYQDYNGVWFLSGIEAGAEVKTYTSGSGNFGGENGYNFTIVSNDIFSAQEISNDYYIDNIVIPANICDTGANEGAELGNTTPLWQIGNCIFFD